jgi:hypothetical protein
MPDDYLHLLNCICLFDVNKRKDCWNAGDVMVVGATKLTADSWSSVVDDVYNQPTKKRPYYYVHNQNDIDVTEDNTIALTNSNLPTNSATDALHLGVTMIDTELPSAVSTAIDTAAVASAATKATVLAAAIAATTDETIKAALNDKANSLANSATAADAAAALKTVTYQVPGIQSNFARTFEFNGIDPTGDEANAAIEKPAGSRYANSSRVKVEIRCGRDKSNIFSLSAVQVDYVKAPQFINLTQEQLDSDEDISQVMEFPDYVNQEIVNELVNLVMRKTNDPSLSAHM